MRNVRFGDTGLTTSVLGYGCTGLMRPLDPSDRYALLAAAFDEGIRHFDIARYYGHGGAEGVLGQFLASNNLRDQVTITTKFGLEPSPISNSPRGRSIMNLGRRVSASSPMIRKLLSAFAQRTTRANRFDVRSAASSLDMSLRELRTDRIDLFLLHGASLEDTRALGLLDFLENAKRSGKILSFGLGTDHAQSVKIIEHAPAFARVVQIEHSLTTENLQRLPRDPQRLVITHSVLKALPVLESALVRSPLSAKQLMEWRRALHVDASALGTLLLALALHENPRGVTLFSSLQSDRIRENVRCSLQAAALTDADWYSFKAIAHQALRGSSDVTGV